MRALIAIRLSKVTDASPERQLQTCLELCNQRGHEAAGVAEELDVSGAVDPFDRKKRPNLDLGDLYQITEERNVGGPVVEWQEILTAMAESRFRA
jgi:hypothetical protein